MTSTDTHIAFHTRQQTEAYLPDTGLAVWEVAWVAEAYEGDVEQTAEHLGIEHELVREALHYAAAHPGEIGVQIHDHVMWTEEDMRRAYPRIEVVPVEIDGSEPLTS